MRSDDPDYLALVERFWKKIYKEVEGTHCILGIQVENEYGHVGGLRGAAGEQHMRALTKLTKTIGFEAPYLLPVIPGSPLGLSESRSS